VFTASRIRQRWTSRAAYLGDADTQLELGIAYQSGVGVGRYPVEAIRWLRKAAEQDNGDAEIRLGLVYRHGIGVAPDNVEASRWYRLAQQHGDSVNQELWAIDLVRNPDPQSRNGAAAVQLA
jgi:TPR repeat protein